MLLAPFPGAFGFYGARSHPHGMIIAVSFIFVLGVRQKTEFDVSLVHWCYHCYRLGDMGILFQHRTTEKDKISDVKLRYIKLSCALFRGRSVNGKVVS